MKTLVLIILSIALSVTTLIAQSTPTPPTPPNVSVHSDETNSKTSYSYSVSDDDQDSNTSISISNSDKDYSFRARYTKKKDNEIKEHLLKELGRNNFTESNGKMIWEAKTGNDEVYEIELRSGKLTMDLDKRIASNSLTEKMIKLGKSVKFIITGDNDKKREAERLQRDAERLQRDAARMQREAVRLKERARNDSDRIQREAERLARNADRVEDEARHRGGVSTIIKELLTSNSTLYKGDQRTNNWVLPGALNALTGSLKRQSLLSDENEINFTKDETGIYVDGEKLSRTQAISVNSVLASQGVSEGMHFSINTKNNHIVLVNGNANLEECLEAMVRQNVITSLKKKMELKINGNSVYRNGEQLSQSEVAKINNILQKHYIIAAPGKTLKIQSKGNFTLGYSRDKTHLGTWVSNY